jgi:sarcosine oxidase gamma subunit
MDRYTKIVLTVIAVALVVIAVRPLAPSVLERVRLDVAQAQTISPKYDVTLPKAWGKYVSFSNGNLLLEGPDGWRIVDVEGKMPEYPKVKALIRWQ